MHAESSEEERYRPALRDRDGEGAVRRAPHSVRVPGTHDPPMFPVVGPVAACEIKRRIVTILEGGEFV